MNSHHVENVCKMTHKRGGIRLGSYGRIKYCLLMTESTFSCRQHQERAARECKHTVAEFMILTVPPGCTGSIEQWQIILMPADCSVFLLVIQFFLPR